MSLQLGNTKIKEVYLGSIKIAQMYLGSTRVFEAVDPYNPLNLPPNTVRVRTNDGNPPIKDEDKASYESATLVSGTTDTYDVYKSGSALWALLWGSTNVVEVIAANTTGIVSMAYMFKDCSSLTTIPLFDTSKVKYLSSMFYGCRSLVSVPLFDTSNVTDMDYMFTFCESLKDIPLFDTSKVTNMEASFLSCSNITAVPLLNTSNVTFMKRAFAGCNKVQSGALALYKQASTQATPPSEHDYAFRTCGQDTTTGAAELAQIPDDWK